MFVSIGGGKRVGLCPSKWIGLSQDSTSARGRLFSPCHPAVILRDFSLLMGGLFLALPPQSLGLHNSRRLPLLSILAVCSHGHAHIFPWISSTLMS